MDSYLQILKLEMTSALISIVLKFENEVNTMNLKY